MKTWMKLLPVPVVLGLLAMQPQSEQGSQDPNVADIVQIMPMTEMHYVDMQGKSIVVPSRNVFEVRMIEDVAQGIRIELLYDNGDYSLIDAQALHILRSGKEPLDVRFVRSMRSRMRYPKMR